MIDGQLYHGYNLHQAENHPDLLHSDTNLVFAQVGVEEAVGDLRSANVSAKGYIMRSFNPSFRIKPGEQAPEQQFDGGFLIARRYDMRNVGTSDYRDAMNGSERIAVDIIRKMYADSVAGHPLFHYKAHSHLTVTARERPVTGDMGYCGWMIFWSLPNIFCYESPATGPAWVDGGLTPFE